MLILAINTATDALGVGLVDCTDPLAVRAELILGAASTAGPKGAPRRAGHSEGLLPAIDWIAHATGIGPADIQGIAVVAGPGGFTGVRTGLAAAKAMAQVRAIPIWGVDTLEALAAGQAREGLVSPLLDARRGDVFAALYRRSGATGLEAMVAPTLVALPAWLARMGQEHPGEPIALVGEGARAHPDAIAAHPAAVAVSPEAHLIRPAVVARLAAPHLAEGGADPVTLVPRYHRAPAMAPDWNPGAGMKP